MICNDLALQMATLFVNMQCERNFVDWIVKMFDNKKSDLADHLSIGSVNGRYFAFTAILSDLISVAVKYMTSLSVCRMGASFICQIKWHQCEHNRIVGRFVVKKSNKRHSPFATSLNPTVMSIIQIIYLLLFCRFWRRLLLIWPQLWVECFAAHANTLNDNFIWNFFCQISNWPQTIILRGSCRPTHRYSVASISSYFFSYVLNPSASA